MPEPKPSQTNSTVLVALADYFKVLSEVSRLQILTCLKSGPMNVMDLVDATGLGQANLSKHLKVLTQAGLVSRQTKGTNAFYAITDPMIFELCDLACDRISQHMLQQSESLKALRDNTAVFSENRG